MMCVYVYVANKSTLHCVVSFVKLIIDCGSLLSRPDNDKWGTNKRNKTLVHEQFK